MAEGGTWSSSFKDSISKASGDADETFCDPCKNVGKFKYTEGFCQICDEYLCDTCLEVHKNLKITKAHTIMDKNQMPRRQGSLGNQDLCVDVCKTHHPEIIRFHCTAHDEPGCGDCMTLNHTTCKKDRVQDISDGFQKTKEFQDIDQHLQQLQQDLEAMDSELNKNLKNLDTTYNNLLHKIAAVRQQINKYLDQMEQKIRDEAAQLKTEDENLLKTWIAENQAMKADTESMLQILHASNANVNSLFVTAKQAKHRLVTMENEAIKIKHQSQQQQQYEFFISNEIENIVSAKTPLGKMSRKFLQKRSDVTKKQDQKTSRKPTINTKATYNRSIEVQRTTDKKDCYIADCTLISADRLVVTDKTNRNVKLIDLSNNTVISTYSTSSLPYTVAVLSTNTIAITLPDECKIQVLNVTSTFTSQQEIKVNNNCRGIAYKDGKFAVSYVNPVTVEILDIHGKILHTIQPKQGKKCILEKPDYLTFGQDNDAVIISDRDANKVIVVTFSGQVLRTYTHDTSRHPCGIVITADGVLFVCCYGNRCIHVVSPDFKTSQIIIKQDKHAADSKAIAYCETNHKLYISNTTIGRGHLNNYIQVYDLTVPE